MILSWAISMFAVTHLLQGCQGLTWLHDLKDGEQMIRCVGQVARIPWEFSVLENETVIAISWTRLSDDKNPTNLANFAFDDFMTSNKRILRVGYAGIQLSDLRINDTAAYILQVRIGSQTVKQQTVHLLVAEEAETMTDSMEAKVVRPSGGNGSHNGGQRLMCGHFITRGFPPMSVIWEDPEGNLLPSTDYKNGFFILDLPEENKGGDYYCLLNLTSPATWCLAGTSRLRERYLVGVVGKTSISPATAGLDGGVVAAIIIAVIVIAIIAIVIGVYVWKSKGRGKSYSPKEPESPGPDTEAMEPLKV